MLSKTQNVPIGTLTRDRVTGDVWIYVQRGQEFGWEKIGGLELDKIMDQLVLHIGRFSPEYAMNVTGSSDERIRELETTAALKQDALVQWAKRTLREAWPGR